MRIPHPIPYQGSKRRLAPAILAWSPPTVERIVEPFAGSAALSLAAMATGQARSVALNDANAPLMALWDAIVHQPASLAEAYAEVWDGQHGRERAYFAAVRAEFNRTAQPQHLLFLLTRCVKAAVRYNAQGAFNQSADHRRRGTHPNTMRRQILDTARLLGNKTSLSAADYRDVLSTSTSHDLVYLDPPYQGVCGPRDQRYAQTISFADFVEALRWLNQREIAYLLSYDGRSGSKAFGQPLPSSLHLQRIELDAGPSAQATLLGRRVVTHEALYLSPALLRRREVVTYRSIM